MKAEAAPSCENCARMQAELERLRQQLLDLQGTVARLPEELAAARKDSSTSSKPPSSDMVKPPKPEPSPGQDKRKAGGQPGHPKHERALFPPEQVNDFFDHHPDPLCPRCCVPLVPTGLAPRIVQQIDLNVIPLNIEEHRCHQAYCSRCGDTFAATLPVRILKGGLLGPNLTALIAYLKGLCHASFSTIRTFLRDVVGLQIARSQLIKVINKVSEALETTYQEFLDDLPNRDFLNVDETGHKDNGQLFWTWCFKAELYTLFKIDPTRPADVLLEVLGEEFDGTLGCDFWGAYKKFIRLSEAKLQFCLAHLIREVKFLCTLADGPTRAYGERFREALRELFAVIHRREQYSAAEFQQCLERAREEVRWQATHLVPASQAAQRLAGRMEKFGEGYFEFLTTPGVGPTNDAAEQAIRLVVIDRKVTQGTRSRRVSGSASGSGVWWPVAASRAAACGTTCSRRSELGSPARRDPACWALTPEPGCRRACGRGCKVDPDREVQRANRRNGLLKSTPGGFCANHLPAPEPPPHKPAAFLWSRSTMRLAYSSFVPVVYRDRLPVQQLRVAVAGTAALTSRTQGRPIERSLFQRKVAVMALHGGDRSEYRSDPWTSLLKVVVDVSWIRHLVQSQEAFNTEAAIEAFLRGIVTPERVHEFQAVLPYLHSQDDRWPKGKG